MPVRALADLPLGMTSHVVFDALDADNPATLSPVVIRFLRETLGFDGLLMTDDIEMNALGGAMVDRAARAIAAGCDRGPALLRRSDRDGGRVATASGCCTGRGLARADAALAARRAPDLIDIAALDAEFDRLSHSRA